MIFNHFVDALLSLVPRRDILQPFFKQADVGLNVFVARFFQELCQRILRV